MEPKLTRMLLHVFKQIEKSDNPEANMKWFVSDEAKQWYKDYKEGKFIDRVVESWVDEVFKDKS